MLRSSKGFTLIEMIMVMVILSVMAIIIVPKFLSLDDSAERKALTIAIRILNSNEKMAWMDLKISTGWVSDENMATYVEYNLGDKYKWSNGPNLDGGTLSMTSANVNLIREASTNANPGIWKEN